MKHGQYSALLLACTLWSCDGGTLAPAGSGPEVRYAAVAAGGAHTCALDVGGAAYCWGRGSTGALGLAPPRSSLIPLPLPGSPVFATITASFDHSCATTPDGAPYCWGQGERGKLGNNGEGPAVVPSPVAGELRFVELAAGGAHTCGVTSAGDVYCWGRGTTGELGAGSLEDASTPQAAIPQRGGVPYSRVTAGQHHSCALDDAGTPLCWGWNHFGQVGIGVNVTIGFPERLPGAANLVGISAGREHSCGVSADGAAYCWGRGDFGQLGDGALQHRSAPVAVAGGHSFRQISAGAEHTCAVTFDGRAYCWGDNTRGRLGVGGVSAAPRSVPAEVSGGVRFTMVDAGSRHTCGVSVEQRIYCWGAGGFGQLGTGDANDSAVPVLVARPGTP
jgi:alpha-tubulin suppressor-like RCC1 family protein